MSEWSFDEGLDQDTEAKQGKIGPALCLYQVLDVYVGYWWRRNVCIYT